MIDQKQASGRGVLCPISSNMKGPTQRIGDHLKADLFQSVLLSDGAQPSGEGIAAVQNRRLGHRFISGSFWAGFRLASLGGARHAPARMPHPKSYAISRAILRGLFAPFVQ